MLYVEHAMLKRHSMLCFDWSFKVLKKNKINKVI